MPTIFEIFGLRFFFYSNEHRPIHVHVAKGEDDAKIEIESEIKLISNHGLKAKDVKRALDLVRIYKEEIVEVWHQYHD